MSAPHSALDSLKWLAETTTLLEWAAEEATGVNGDVDDEAIADALLAFRDSVRSELALHGGPTPVYSTGHPVRVAYREPGTEPGVDGVTQIVIRNYSRTAYPDGTLKAIGSDGGGRE